MHRGGGVVVGDISLLFDEAGHVLRRAAEFFKSHLEYSFDLRDCLPAIFRGEAFADDVNHQGDNADDLLVGVGVGRSGAVFVGVSSFEEPSGRPPIARLARGVRSELRASRSASCSAAANWPANVDRAWQCA